MDSLATGITVPFAGLALVALPWPFVLAPAALALGAFRLARARRGQTRGRLAALAGSLALAVGVAELALPGPAAPFLPCEHDDSARPTDEEAFDAVLGVAPPRARVVPAAGMRGNIGFEGVYSLDEHGLRRPYPSAADEAVLFFGCSYMFGLNVADEETLPYLAGQASAQEYACHNFGYTGYGAQQMLAGLQSGRVQEALEGAPKHVFFQLIDSHVRRAVGNGWRLHGPRYELADDGTVIRNGRLCDPPSEPGFVGRRLRKSAIYRKLTSHTLPSHVDTLLGILRTARDEVERRYPGCRFHVIVWDKGTWKTRRLLKGLRQAEIPLLLTSEILPGIDEDYDSWFLSEQDHHPRPEANRLLAEAVVGVLRGSDERQASGARVSR